MATKRIYAWFFSSELNLCSWFFLRSIIPLLTTVLPTVASLRHFGRCWKRQKMAAAVIGEHREGLVVIIVSIKIFSCSCRRAFHSCDFGQTEPVALGAAKSRDEKCFDQFPGEGLADHTSTQAHQVQVVVLDPLMR